MPDFACTGVHSWEQFNEIVLGMGPQGPSKVRQWLYRGQTDDLPLKTTIERTLVGWGISLERASSIEFQTIREFRRRLRDPQYHMAQEDTLYCLALMRHHFAPTRLLDCTYSPFVAAAFAMENGIFLTKDASPSRPVIWCFNGEWCEKEAKRNLPRNKEILMTRRNKDARRNDHTFIPLFQIKTSKTTGRPKWKFVKVENPLHLNERLTAQQGGFLCPANIETSLEDNIKAMGGWYVEANLRKLCLRLNKKEAEVFARNLKHMNISFAALLPGLDGFAKSINQQIVHYDELGRGSAGL